MSELLKEGDIFEVTEGMSVTTTIPCHFVYANHIGDWSLTDHVVDVEKGFYGYLIGSYIVISTDTERIADDMGMGALREQTYTNAYKVEAVKTNNTNIKISFYQNGYFTSTNAGVKKTGQGKLVWVVEND